MIKGISFKIPSNEHKVLEKILKEVDIKDYYCCNVKNQSEAWIEKDRNEAFLKKEIYNGNDFQSQISKEYFIIFLILFIYISVIFKLNLSSNTFFFAIYSFVLKPFTSIISFVLSL